MESASRTKPRVLRTMASTSQPSLAASTGVTPPCATAAATACIIGAMSAAPRTGGSLRLTPRSRQGARRRSKHSRNDIASLASARPMALRVGQPDRPIAPSRTVAPSLAVFAVICSESTAGDQLAMGSSRPLPHDTTIVGYDAIAAILPPCRRTAALLGRRVAGTGREANLKLARPNSSEHRMV